MSDQDQTMMDIRSQMETDIEDTTTAAISRVLDAITSAKPPAVHNRHEAYGIAAEHYNNVATKLKSVKGDVVALLGTLPNPNYPAVEAASSLCNSTVSVAMAALRMAAEMRRTLNDLYIAENNTELNTPMEQLAGCDDDGFVEAEPTDIDE